MKKFILIVATIILLASLSFGQGVVGTQFSQQFFFNTTVSSVNQPGLPESSLANSHTLFWTTTGTAVGTITLQGSASYASGYATLTASTGQNIATSGSYTFQGQTAAFVSLLVNISTCTACTVNITYVANTPIYGQFQDGFASLSLGNCGAALTTGAYAANPANAGATAAPILVRAAAGEQLLQVTTSAAASALTVDCDITPPTRSTTGKGVTVTGYTIYYGVQTTALSSVATPLVNTITFPSPGVAAQGVVASVGGTMVLNPVSPVLTTTTLGQCNALNVTFTTPQVLNTLNQRLETTLVFNQVAASAAVYQVCGLEVFYSNTPI